MNNNKDFVFVLLINTIMNNNEDYNKINIRLSMNSKYLSAMIGKDLVTINNIRKPFRLQFIGDTCFDINRSVKRKINER